MATISIDYDSSGDVELILQNHIDFGAGEAEKQDVPTYHVAMLKLEVKGVRLRVSSSKLITSSRYFQAMLGGDVFNEGRELKEHGFVKIEMLNPEDDPDAMMIILGILYNNKGVQITDTLESSMLYKIAVLVDKYEWYKPVINHAVSWYQKIVQAKTLPNTVGDDLFMWLWMAWLFGVKDSFKELSAVAAKGAYNVINAQDENIRLPTAIIDAINYKRENALKTIEQVLQATTQKLLDQEDQKKDSNTAAKLCRYMVFGHATFLSQELRLREFALPSYAGTSFLTLRGTLQRSYGLHEDGVNTAHNPSLKWKIHSRSEWDLKAQLLNVVQQMDTEHWGLDYDEFIKSQAKNN